MKNIKFLYFLAFGLLFAGCLDESTDPVFSANTAPTIIAPAANSSYVLDETMTAADILTMEWEKADFGYDAAVEYAIELDFATGDFTSPASLGVSTATSKTFTQGELNAAMTALEAVVNVPNSMLVRVIASPVGVEGVNGALEAKTSETLAIEVNPFLADIDYPVLYVPGAYQGWDPSNEATVVYSVGQNGKYEGYAYFPDPNTNFKFTDGPAWDLNFGDDGADGILEQNGSDIGVTDAGTYRLNVDYNALTYTAVKADWGVIGDATPGGWDSDTDLAYDAGTGTYRVELALTAGEIKFRANDDWAIDLGDDGGNSIMEYGGANIPVPTAGNYIVVLKLNQALYSYELIPN